VSKVLLRGGTAAEWAAANPILAARECGVETDTHRLKVGDGVTAWATLPYSSAISDSSVTSAMIVDGTILGTDIASGTVTSANIADGTIVNGDISASASIVGSRLADGAITPIKTSAGYVAKTALYTPTNDDRVIDCTSGTYTVTLPTAAAQTGRTFVIRNSGTGVITIGRTGSETIAGAASQALAGYGSLEVVSNGINWLVLRGQYADETVGRRIWNWNHAYSTGGGWQLTYSDTGMRTDTSMLASGWEVLSTINYLSRTGSLVQYNAILQKTGTGQTVANADTIFTLPAGFRPSTSHYRSITAWQTWPTAGPTALNIANTGAAQYGIATATGLTNPVLYINISFHTVDAWPASLPGSAYGTIPL